MGDRAAALADDFAEANAAAIDFARSCPPDAWARTVPGEEWSVGVVLHHIAVSHENSRRWLSGMASGAGVPESADDIDEANATHAVDAASVTLAETVALLETNGALLEAALRAFGDEELDRTAPFGPAGGRVFSTGDLAPVAARHTREHLAHARSAAGQPA